METEIRRGVHPLAEPNFLLKQEHGRKSADGSVTLLREAARLGAENE